MKSFKSFFTAIALTLILSGTSFANSEATTTPLPPTSIEQSIGKAEFNGVKAEYRTTVTSDFGGSLVEYIEKYNKWRQEGRKIKIDDLCMSACTLVTGLIPPQDVCVSPITKFAFHSAYVMTFAGPAYAEEGTRLLWNIYPEELQKLLTERGWNGGEHPNFLYIKGTELYDLCRN